MCADTVSPRDEGAYRLADVTRKLLNAFFDVYHELGSGFLEPVYANALAVALTHEGVAFRREVSVPVYFRGVLVGSYRADFLVAGEIIVELKASNGIDQTHVAQVINYLCGSSLELGYLFNFGPKPSFKRLIMSNVRKKRLRPLRPPAVP